jgi:hypothetical protein
MRFFEVDSAVDAIMSAAMIAQNRASQRDKQGKLSMNGFLQMLANAGVVVDYEGFKTVFDTNPQLANVIAKFDKDSITFASADAEDEGAGYEEPQTDMPDDERVAKMAQRATKMRTREFVETKLNEDDEQALMRQLMRKDGIDPDKVSDGGIFDKYRAMARKQLGLDEAELPPHLSKMFGKDGTQVDTRTDVMKQMRDIVDNKSAMEVTFGDGKQMVDMYTASVLVQIYDKVNPENKEKIVQRVGTIEKFTKLMPTLFNMIGEGKSPHKKGTEKYRKHMAAMHAGESVNEAWQAFKEGAPKIRYALVGTDMKIYAIGSDERDLRLDRRSLDKRFPDAAPLKMARLKTAQSIGDTVGSDQIKERSLTKPEKRKMKHYEKKLPKQDFIDRYGKEQGEAIYYATATKMAKKNA